MGEQPGATERVASYVKRWRKQSGLSQTRFAEHMLALGCDWGRTTVQKLETGGRVAVTVEELEALSRVMGVSPVALLEDRSCAHCGDRPPPGFTCNDCGRSA